ncbi:sarcosine oxidase subunit alpha family protein [Salinisphaera sp. USBA-960]|nr:sarcosine oxidase subunit alpha family protein [Salifodinibacter halophilus]NNC26911.1 sarcosine oxidase subunit alpha family protein [Salifodinibacter halophilus]
MSRNAGTNDTDRAPSGGHRLDHGGRIDRSKQLRFWYNGRELTGYAGDTLASALMANGIDVLARSFKLRRPRGILTHGAAEPNAIVQVDQGARARPTQRATQTELHFDLDARMVNVWPNAKHNLTGLMGLAGRFMPAGFYYKTFMRPARLWQRYEQVIRKGAGLGYAPEQNDPDVYDKRYAHCDVLVAGAGPAGLMAALTAARSGARVILSDEQNEFGGSLLDAPGTIDGAPAINWVSAVVAELQTYPEVTLLKRSTVFGYYDHNRVHINENRTDHLPPDQRDEPRHRLWKVRARRVICATGAMERPLVFANNDRPGVMMASAAAAYTHRYAVAPGRRAVVFTNNDSGYRAAIELHQAGIEIAAIVDSRDPAGGHWHKQAADAGIHMITRSAVFDVRGNKRVRGVHVARLNANDTALGGHQQTIDCDLLAVAGGWNPVVHLHSQSGARPHFDPKLATFVPGESVQPEASAGSANATFGLAAALAEGAQTGHEAVSACGIETSEITLPTADNDQPEANITPLWRVPHRKSPENGPKQFVDYQNDVSSADLRLAVRENYRHIEHVKRYTALGFGTDQGKLGNINGMAIVAEARGLTPGEVGTTTFRPAYTPVSFGATVGRDVGTLYDATRKTPMHDRHVAAGAVFEDVGQWKRARYYPEPGDTMQDAVDREVWATHTGIGVLDYSTLGQIDVKGPDAAAFLDRIYTNNWQKLKVGGCRYGLMLNEDGSILDDGVSQRIEDDRFLINTSTGGAASVLSWMEDWLQTEWPEMQVYLTSLTDQLSTIAIGGPFSRKLCEEICEGIDFSAEAFPFFAWRDGKAAGIHARVARVSFSGELSFEITVPAQYAGRLWDAVMDAGAKYGAHPYGTETMHVLRAEKGFIIVGQDTDATVTPHDLGMGGLLSKKKDFLGKRSLALAEPAREGRQNLVGIKPHDPNTIVPEGAQLVTDPDAAKPMPMAGFVTSSYYSSRLGHSFGLAMVTDGRNRHGETVYSPQADGRVIPADICSQVFFDPEGKRQNV